MKAVKLVVISVILVESLILEEVDAASELKEHQLLHQAETLLLELERLVKAVAPLTQQAGELTANCL